jgi:hypothetical protein
VTFGALKPELQNLVDGRLFGWIVSKENDILLSTAGMRLRSRVGPELSWAQTAELR